MCKFSAYVALNKATNGQTYIKHERGREKKLNLDERHCWKSWLKSSLPRKDRVWKKKKCLRIWIPTLTNELATFSRSEMRNILLLLSLLSRMVFLYFCFFITETCPFGQRKGPVYQGHTCDELESGNCYNENFRQVCCEMCDKAYAGVYGRSVCVCNEGGSSTVVYIYIVSACD